MQTKNPARAANSGRDYTTQIYQIKVMKKVTTLTAQDIKELKDAEGISPFTRENLIRKNCIYLGRWIIGEYRVEKEVISIELSIYGFPCWIGKAGEQRQEIDSFLIYNDHNGTISGFNSLADLPLIVKKHQAEADIFIKMITAK